MSSLRMTPGLSISRTEQPLRYALPVTVLLAAAAISLAAQTPQADLYVAPDGDDANPGTLVSPLATLEAARDRLRPMFVGIDHDPVIMLRGGTYYLPRTFRIGPEDTCPGRTVTYRNYLGERPVILGGGLIEGWRPAEGQIWATRVDPDRRFNQLFINGRRMTKARHPNGGYAHVQAKDEDRPSNIFGYAEGDIPDWEMGPEAQVYVWASYDWFASLAPIGAIDYANRTITLAEKTHTPIYKRRERRYYIQGVREALDSPGEFYLDEVTGELLLWPPDDAGEGFAAVAPVTTRAIEIAGPSRAEPVESIVLEGLVIGVSGFGRYFNETYHGTHGDTPWNEPANKEGLVYLEHVRGCSVRHCELVNAGYSAVALVGRAQDCEVYGNHIHHAGFHGVLLAGYAGRFGAEEMNVNRDNRAANNHIHHCGRLVGHGGGIFVHSSGHNRVDHNLIHHMPRYGICSKGGVAAPPEVGKVAYGDHWQYTHSRNNVYEYNDIHHCNEDTEDSGFISFHTTGRDNIVRANLIHDGERRLGGLGFGIYLDDGVSYHTVEGNVIYNIAGGDAQRVSPIFAKGIHNVIRDNILVGEDKTHSAIRTLEMANLPCRHHRWYRNIVYLKGEAGHIWGFSNWSDDRLDECDRNILWHAGGSYTVNGRLPDGLKTLTFDQWREMGFDTHSVIADPMFVDPQKHNYALKDGSPALEMGFRQTDTSQCGLLQDFRFQRPAGE